MPEIEIQYLPFVVNDTPYCFWDTDIRQRNIEFINSIDASYFSHMATVHANSLNSEQRQYAAIALRTEYYHSLETLFSLLCAIVQAPDCIIGWLLKYQNRDLCSVVKKIDEYKPLLYRLDMKQVSWESIADEVHKLKTGDEQQDSHLRQSFGHLWR